MRIGVKRINFDYDGQEAWVDVKRPTIAQLLSFAEKVKATDDWKDAMPAMYDFLDLCVVNWNFEDAQGRDLKVDQKTIRSLPASLVLVLVRQVQEVCTEVPLLSAKPSTAQ